MNITHHLQKPLFSLMFLFQLTSFLIPSALLALTFQSIESLPKSTEQLQSDCQCDHLSMAKLIIYGTQDQYNFALSQLQNKSFSCLRSIMKSAAKEIETLYQNSNYNCEQTSNKNTLTCRGAQEDQRVIARRIFFLIDRVMSNTHSISWDDFDLTRSNPLNYSQLVNFIKNVDDHLICRNYQYGEERRIEVPSEEGLRSYLIKKELDGSYTARIALEFSGVDDYDNVDVPRNQVHTHYLNTIQNCIHNIDRFIGPNGERLNIIIEDAKENTNSCTPKYKIYLHHAKYHSSIFDYRSNIHCSLATHEVLHILALVDEYRYFSIKETHAIVLPNRNETIYLQKNNCRIVQSQSIMAHRKDRWDIVFHTPRSSRLAEDSLLDPTHFNAILYGTCSQRNDVNLYRQCSRLVSMTSYDSNGNDLCPPLKKICDSQNILGR